MKNVNGNIIASIIAICIGLFLGFDHTTQANNRAESLIEFGDSCRNVKFEVKNGRDGFIQLTKAKFYNQDENRWQTEQLPSTICSRGQICKTNGDDLRDSEGDDITKVVFEYKTRLHSNDNWSGPIESQEFRPDDTPCREGRKYGNSGWTILSNQSVQLDTDGFGQACKNINFTALNGIEEKEIQITKVRYFNQNEDKWKTETIGANSCRPNQTCRIGPDDLADSDGDNITQIVFEFKTRSKYAEGWSGGYESQQFQPDSPRCSEGREYGAASWVIKASKATSASADSEINRVNDLCRDVTFKYTNGRANDVIKVEQIKHFNRSSGKWVTEQLNVPKQCSPGKTCTTKGQGFTEIPIPAPLPAYDANDRLTWGGIRIPKKGAEDLRDARGDEITKIIFVYKFLAPWSKKWSSKIESEIFEPSDPVCSDGRAYGNGQKWTIGGGSSEQPAVNPNLTTNTPTPKAVKVKKP